MAVTHETLKNPVFREKTSYLSGPARGVHYILWCRTEHKTGPDGETEMKTYEVRIREDSGEVTSDFYQAESAEQLFDHLATLSDSLDVVGYNVVEG